jgi:hypothetical protein
LGNFFTNSSGHPAQGAEMNQRGTAAIFPLILLHLRTSATPHYLDKVSWENMCTGRRSNKLLANFCPTQSLFLSIKLFFFAMHTLGMLRPLTDKAPKTGSVDVYSCTTLPELLRLLKTSTQSSTGCSISEKLERIL